MDCNACGTRSGEELGAKRRKKRRNLKLFALLAFFRGYPRVLNDAAGRRQPTRSARGLLMSHSLVGQTFLSAGWGDFPVARLNTRHESRVNW
jgi:hypothetical protein